MFSAPNPTAFALIQKAFAASSGVTTDTRTASADKLFFALKGENFDGNLYAKEALAKGCIAVVMDDPTLSQHLENAILVEDALKALQALAQWHRRKWDCPVIGLTGSNGKTTTKELLKMVCQNRFPGIQATHGNLNNEIGVPLTLLSISNDPDFVIVEMGANAQGEIGLLAQIAEPTHGIITNIGRAHLEGFGGLDGVIKGKSELFHFFRSSTNASQTDQISLFVNANHKVLAEVSQSIPRLFYGSQEHPPFVSSVQDDFTMSWTDLEGIQHGPLHCHISGEHNFENMMTAAAVGLHFGVTAQDCSRALSAYAPDNNRSQWMKTKSNQVLLDAYNANPSSMESALTFFERMGKTSNERTPLVAILGDMGELGTYAGSAHDDVLAMALEKGMHVITVGPIFHRSAQKHANVQSFSTTAELKLHLEHQPVHGKKVLLKGSRSIALEEALSAL